MKPATCTWSQTTTKTPTGLCVLLRRGCGGGLGVARFRLQRPLPLRAGREGGACGRQLGHGCRQLVSVRLAELLELARVAALPLQVAHQTVHPLGLLPQFAPQVVGRRRQLGHGAVVRGRKLVELPLKLRDARVQRRGGRLVRFRGRPREGAFVGQRFLRLLLGPRLGVERHLQRGDRRAGVQQIAAHAFQFLRGASRVALRVPRVHCHQGINLRPGVAQLGLRRGQRRPHLPARLFELALPRHLALHGFLRRGQPRFYSGQLHGAPLLTPLRLVGGVFQRLRFCGLLAAFALQHDNALL